MQAFKRHKKIVVLAVFLAAIIIVSAFIVQNNSKPSLQHHLHLLQPKHLHKPPNNRQLQHLHPTTPSATPPIFIPPYPTPTPFPTPNPYTLPRRNHSISRHSFVANKRCLPKCHCWNTVHKPDNLPPNSHWTSEQNN